MIKITVGLNAEGDTDKDMRTDDYTGALLELAELFARELDGSSIDDKIKAFRGVLKDASETAEALNNEVLKDLLKQDFDKSRLDCLRYGGYYD